MSTGVTSVASGPASAWDRYPIVRVATLVVTGTFLVLGAWNLTILVPQMIGLKAAIGVDYNLYMSATDSWLGGGSFYLERQLDGAYEIHDGDVLYPPTILWLLVPFSRLPAILWWAIPTAVIGWAIWRVRPAWWSWPVLAFILWYPRTEAMFLYGNPGIWIVAAVAASTRWRSASTLVLLKPSLGFLALFGARRRSWWIALGILALASLPMAGLWLDYAGVVSNSNVGLAYSLQDLPPSIAPLLAWLARTRTDPRAPSPVLAGSIPAGEAEA
jgi:hypothetical protein